MSKGAFMGPDRQAWLDSFKFSIPLRIRYCETDMLGHVNNVSYFMYFEQGRIEYFENLELSDDLFGSRMVSVVADLECQYLAQIYLKDRLQLHVKSARIGRSSIDIHYALTVEGELKAAGRGAIVLIDKESGRSAPLPETAREALRKFEGPGLEE
ncbi:acyl-CoA thioesterase [Paenibacillus pasadenensis]|uniref:acyl-CoA thioesterase n=1 Tax=Paenibacillus pasadenensis TaxID=217090 RepID=UPI002041EE51|nr:thioesterase family protein [Paenibacillus pasadenensis]MCM3749207.1 acyl-CoA thioesterase [Paenibacillus pasadenensis]